MTRLRRSRRRNQRTSFSDRVRYALRDEFLLAAAAPLGTRIASPGPGTLVFTDANSKWSIAGGDLVWIADTAVSGFWGGQATSRALGKHMHIAFTASDVSNFYTGWRAFQSLASTLQPGIGSFAQAGLRLGSFVATVDAGLPSPFATATRYEFLFVLRAAGSFILFRAGASGAWKLAMVERVTAGATIYPVLFNDAATASSAGVCHFVRVPENRWHPYPLASDSFTRDDSTDLGVTNGLGDSEVSGGNGVAWEEIVGDSAIASNALAVDASGGIAAVDVGQANVLVDCTLTPDATARGVAFRISDATNFWRATITSGGVLNVSKVVDGTPESAANTTGITTGSNQRLLVIADGNAITAYYFGAALARAAVASDSFNSTATKHGGYQATIDNFAVWPRSVVYPYELAA